GLGTVVPPDLYDIAEQLETVERDVGEGAIRLERLETGVGAIRHGAGGEGDRRQKSRRRGLGNVSRKAEGGRIEAIAGVAPDGDEPRPVPANIHHQSRRKAVNVVERRPLINSLESVAISHIVEVGIFFLKTIIVASVEPK